MGCSSGLLEHCLAHGYTVIPLAGKVPLVKWKAFQQFPPTQRQVQRWFESFPDAGVGIVTSQASGIICLDCDKPPYPDGAYYETPSGGRHYWYPIDPDDGHGTDVSPGHDIPWVVRVYSTPEINASRIPEQPASSTASHIARTGDWESPDHPPNMDDLLACSFIKWFQEKRNDPNWDGRYNLARAYATNVSRVENPDTSLGPDYQHEDGIYERNHYPITCQRIVEYGYPCPHFHRFSRVCMKAAGVRSPFGLAQREASQ